MAVAFAAWGGDNLAAKLMSASAARQRDAKSKALLHLLHRGLSKGWRSLVAHWEASRAALAQQRSCLAHAANRELSVGGRTWHSYATERAAALQPALRSN